MFSRSRFLLSEKANSRVFRAKRASPWARLAKYSRAGFVMDCLGYANLIARLIILVIALESRDFKTMTREREMSGEITSKLGFSVVAPIRVIRPDST